MYGDPFTTKKREKTPSLTRTIELEYITINMHYEFHNFTSVKKIGRNGK